MTSVVNAEALGETVIATRDRHTLEIRQFYPLPHRTNESFGYALDIYFFFPQSIGITSSTWDRATFYRHSNILTRIQAPALSLSTLGDASRDENPASILLQRIAALSSDISVNGASMTALAQMLGTEIADGVNLAAAAINASITQVRSIEDAARLLEQVETFCAQCMRCLTLLRQLRQQAQLCGGAAPPGLVPSLQFAEEYCHAVVDEGLSSVAVNAAGCAALYNGEGSAVRLRLLAAHTLEDLLDRRRVRGFVSPSHGDGEYYAYRLGLLKKELQRSLYVNTRSINADPFWTNATAGVAAGLAATWSTLAEVPHHGGGGHSGNIVLATLGVAAYILKDRIKDLGKQHLARLASKWDHNISLQGDKLASVGLGAFSGRARERFSAEKEGQLPRDVAHMRRRTRTVRGASTGLEHVFHYRRHLTVSATDASPLPDGYGLEEIFRLNMSDVLRRLDEPDRSVVFYGGDGDFRQESLPKVYHLNIIVVGRDIVRKTEKQVRVRVVMNKRQILRVEKVSQT